MASHFFAASVWATLSCTSAVTASHSGRKVYARVVLQRRRSCTRLKVSIIRLSPKRVELSVSMNASLQNAPARGQQR